MFLAVDRSQRLSLSVCLSGIDTDFNILVTDRLWMLSLSVYSKIDAGFFISVL